MSHRRLVSVSGMARPRDATWMSNEHADHHEGWLRGEDQLLAKQATLFLDEIHQDAPGEISTCSRESVVSA